MGTSSIKGGLPFVTAEHIFGFCQRLHLPSLQTVHLNKVSPFNAPQTGDSCWQWIGGSKLWSQLNEGEKIFPLL